MSSVFISYSHDPTDPQHDERVAGLAASLMQDGITVFFDLNRGDDEEKVPWPIWMDDKIAVADHVLLICTELYWKKVRQKLGDGAGLGVCWEANLIYNHLYVARLNTTKFVPILFSSGHKGFIPTPLQGAPHFVLDSDQAYGRLCAFLTGQHRRRSPGRYSAVVPIAQKVVEPLFPLKAATTLPPATSSAASISPEPASRNDFDSALQPDDPPPPRRDILDPPPSGAAASRLGIFLCHSSGDKPLARTLYKRLLADGFQPWLDEENLLPGHDWRHEIERAVRTSDIVIVCLSQSSITKEGFVQKEIKYALDVADEKPEGTIFIIPLRVELCDVPERLRRWQWVDYFEQDAHSRLLRALRVRANATDRQAV